jgi:formate hydrogenlyase subunit 6/NADH:ubiquinone oxidoreductase subunit I
MSGLAGSSIFCTNVFCRPACPKEAIEPSKKMESATNLIILESSFKPGYVIRKKCQPEYLAKSGIM